MRQLLDLTVDARQTPDQKVELINRCVERIKNMKEKIKEVRANNELTMEEKQKKIKRICEIIASDEYTIKTTKEYLERKRQRTYELFGIKTK